MIVIWGTRNVRRHRGYVADFCEICREIKPFRLQDIQVVHHLFFLPISKGETTSQMRTCTTCGQQAFPEPGAYASFVPGAQTDLDTLVQETNPKLLEELTDRLVLEEKAKQSPKELAEGERTALLTEPFLALSGQVDRRFAPGGCANVLGALALVVGLFLACLWIVYSDETKGALYALVTAGGVVGAALIVYALWSFATSNRRYMKGRIVPLLAKALAPLEPSEAELAKVIATLRAGGQKIGRKLKASWIIDAMKMAPAHAESPKAA